mmetsp:Transcript_70882/g.229464  ORF Transcript_70882/g.229464 Transcript_70882/m.229464 type:complete len:358 (-) Transcript_70882:53-1126(-)
MRLSVAFLRWRQVARRSVKIGRVALCLTRTAFISLRFHEMCLGRFRARTLARTFRRAVGSACCWSLTSRSVFNSMATPATMSSSGLMHNFALRYLRKANFATVRASFLGICAVTRPRSAKGTVGCSGCRIARLAARGHDSRRRSPTAPWLCTGWRGRALGGKCRRERSTLGTSRSRPHLPCHGKFLPQFGQLLLALQETLLQHRSWFYLTGAQLLHIFLLVQTRLKVDCPVRTEVQPGLGLGREKPADFHTLLLQLLQQQRGRGALLLQATDFAVQSAVLANLGWLLRKAPETPEQLVGPTVALLCAEQRSHLGLQCPREGRLKQLKQPVRRLLRLHGNLHEGSVVPRPRPVAPQPH